METRNDSYSKNSKNSFKNIFSSNTIEYEEKYHYHMNVDYNESEHSLLDSITIFRGTEDQVTSSKRVEPEHTPMSLIKLMSHVASGSYFKTYTNLNVAAILGLILVVVGFYAFQLTYGLLDSVQNYTLHQRIVLYQYLSVIVALLSWYYIYSKAPVDPIFRMGGFYSFDILFLLVALFLNWSYIVCTTIFVVEYIRLGQNQSIWIMYLICLYLLKIAELRYQMNAIQLEETLVTLKSRDEEDYLEDHLSKLEIIEYIRTHNDNQSTYNDIENGSTNDKDKDKEDQQYRNLNLSENIQEFGDQDYVNGYIQI